VHDGHEHEHDELGGEVGDGVGDEVGDGDEVDDPPGVGGGVPAPGIPGFPPPEW
jgi:hypothetical protein